MAEQFGLMKIIELPPGEASEETRRAWIGLEIPCGELVKVGTIFIRDFISQVSRFNEYEGYLSPQDQAIAILARSSEAAVHELRIFGCPKPEGSFFFPADCVEIICERPTKAVVIHDNMDPLGTHDDYNLLP
jgi:hypothetical protein